MLCRGRASPRADQPASPRFPCTATRPCRSRSPRDPPRPPHHRSLVLQSDAVLEEIGDQDPADGVHFHFGRAAEHETVEAALVCLEKGKVGIGIGKALGNLGPLFVCENEQALGRVPE